MQGGTAFADVLSTVLVGENGSIILAGFTSGSWIENNAGEEDYLVIKLDSDGNEIWVWQVWGSQDGPTCFFLFHFVRRWRVG